MGKTAGKKDKKQEDVKIPKELAEQFTPEQLELSIQTFDAKSKEGVINGDDLHLLLRLAGGTPTDAQIVEWAKEVVDKENNMDLMAFLKCSAKEFACRLTDADILVAFNTFDLSNSGNVNADVIKMALMDRGEPFEEDIAGDFVNGANPDENGNIDYRAFISAVNQSLEKKKGKKGKKGGKKKK